MAELLDKRARACTAMDWLAASPSDWFVVFRPYTRLRWLKWLPIGHHKHVMAFGWVEDAKVWIMVNVGWDRTHIAVMPDERMEAMLTEELFGADVVKVPAGEPRRLPYFGFWCVPAIAHIVGVNSGALRPDTFLRDCLKAGGVLING